MSLADTIIDGSKDDVILYLEQHPHDDVSDTDEYGFTPLVEAVIMEKPDILVYLISKSAKINGSDITGRTPLHWAVEYGDADVVERLLQSGADPNAYTTGTQPVLVPALLRKQHKVKQILFRYGADLNFAKDYINTKLIGHRFELHGQVDIISNNGKFIDIEYEGFYFEFTLDIISHSLERFRNHFIGKKYKPLFNHIHTILSALYLSHQLITYEGHEKKRKQDVDQLEKWLTTDPLIIPVSHYGHAVILIKYKNWLAICDRGHNSLKHGSVNIFRIENPEAFDSKLIYDLLYEPLELSFLENELFNILSLTSLHKLPIASQTVGNCSWANVEAAIPTLLFMMSQYKEINPELNQQTAIDFFDAWLGWDKHIAIDDLINSFYESTNPARKASKAAILGGILFQTCSYDSMHDMQVADKILKVISHGTYRYVLQSYIDTYMSDPENNPGNNLRGILEETGVNY